MLPEKVPGPTKAWLVTHRNEPKVRPCFDRAYGKRPRLELYDLKKDPHQINNVVLYQVVNQKRQMTENRSIAEIDEVKFCEMARRCSVAVWIPRPSRNAAILQKHPALTTSAKRKNTAL